MSPELITSFAVITITLIFHEIAKFRAARQRRLIRENRYLSERGVQNIKAINELIK